MTGTWTASAKKWIFFRRMTGSWTESTEKKVYPQLGLRVWSKFWERKRGNIEKFVCFFLSGGVGPRTPFENHMETS